MGLSEDFAKVQLQAAAATKDLTQEPRLGEWWSREDPTGQQGTHPRDTKLPNKMMGRSVTRSAVTGTCGSLFSGFPSTGYPAVGSTQPPVAHASPRLNHRLTAIVLHPRRVPHGHGRQWTPCDFGQGQGEGEARSRLVVCCCPLQTVPRCTHGHRTGFPSASRPPEKSLPLAHSHALPVLPTPPPASLVRNSPPSTRRSSTSSSATGP